MSKTRHTCYICGRKRYRHLLEKLPVLNISLFHLSWTNTYICKPELGRSWRHTLRRPDASGIHRAYSLCQDKHQEQLEKIIEEFTAMRSGEKVSVGSDKSAAAKLSPLNGHLETMNNKEIVNHFLKPKSK